MQSYLPLPGTARVVDVHGAELKEEFLRQLPPAVAPLVREAALLTTSHNIQVQWQLQDGDTLQGPTIDIDELVHHFPDCYAALPKLGSDTIVAIALDPDVAERLQAQVDWERLPAHRIIERALRAYFADETQWTPKYFNDGTRIQPYRPKAPAVAGA